MLATVVVVEHHCHRMRTQVVAAAGLAEVIVAPDFDTDSEESAAGHMGYFGKTY